MPDMEAKLNARQAREKLGWLRGFVSGGRYRGPGGAAGASAFEATMQVVGTMACEDLRDHFRAQSEAGSTWPELSVVTVVLRRGGPKVYTLADIEAKRGQLKKLRDTNELYRSLEPGAPGNVLEVLPRGLGVRVGTRLQRAKRLQKGGRSHFRFDEAMAERFKRNVSPVKRGRRKPAARKSGKRRVWKRAGKVSPWNPLYFRLRGALRKMSGKSYRVPARPFIVREALRLGRYVAVIERRMGRFKP